MNEAQIHEKIKNYCMAAISYGRKLKKPLDGSMQGVLNLEKIFDTFYRDLYGNPVKQFFRKVSGKTLTHEHVEAMAKILGTYLGEQIRAKLGEGCKWVENKDGAKLGEFRLSYGDLAIYPVEKAFDRLVKGKTENIVNYYKSFGT